MNKLIELLNEWYEERYNVNPCFDRFEDYWGNDYWYFCSSKRKNLMNETEVWTKKYWFIKWLVDNDKIDLMKLDSRIALSEFNKTERFLMALSIQDNPIEFLYSILK